MMSYTQTNLDQISADFISEMFYFWQGDSTGGAPQYELNSFVTMATYWVPHSPDIN